jgi:hypothetical protein
MRGPAPGQTGGCYRDGPLLRTLGTMAALPSAAQSPAAYRALLDAIRPELGRFDSNEVRGTIERCLARGVLGPLATLPAGEKRLLLELVDRHLGPSRRADPKAIVALAEVLSPLDLPEPLDGPAHLNLHPSR